MVLIQPSKVDYDQENNRSHTVKDGEKREPSLPIDGIAIWYGHYENSVANSQKAN